MIHSLTWITPLVTLFLFRVLFAHPQWIFWIAPLVFFIVFIAIWLISGRSHTLSFWQFLISPQLLITGEIIFLSIVEGRLLRSIAAIVLSIFLMVFMENLYVFWNQKDKYQKYSFVNISSYFNLIIIFMFASSFYWAKLFLGVSLWLSIPFMGAIALLVTYQMLAVGRFKIQENILYVAIISFILIEFFGAVYFLPTSIYINAAIVTLVYYVMAGIARNNLLKILDGKIIFRYVGIGSACLVLILATAKYI